MRRRRGKTTRLWAAAALGPCLTLGCADDDRAPRLSGRANTTVPGCESQSYELCDVLDAGCQRGIYSLMACLRGDADALGEMPPVQLLDEDGAIELLSGLLADLETEDDESADFLSEVRGLEMLGLIEAGLLESEADVLDVGVESLLAFYLIPTREIVIIDRGEPLDDLDADAVLAHEMVHALQDQEHDLRQFGRLFSSTADRSLASTSVVEGEATFQQMLMMSAHMGVSPAVLDYQRIFDFVVDSAKQLTLEEGSPFVTAESIFPYTYGARYVGEEWLAGGNAAVDALYAAPPGSSLEVMFGGAAWDVALDELPRAPQALDGYALVSDDVAGAWVLRGLLDVHELGDDDQVESLARAWRGDRFWIYAGPGDEVAAVWSVRLGSERDAETLASLLGVYRPPVGELRVQQEGDAVHVVVAGGEATADAWASSPWLDAPAEPAPEP